ncbi:MAG: carbohydrate binding domain-containing protein [Balneolaceae bacterium]|nr:carbohydrate binding domain-containing protein [Balneolaceae bacterium]
MIALTGTSVTAQDNIISNGDFSAGDLTNWETYVHDGVSATIASGDNQASITEISGAGQAVWHVQLFQTFTSDQLASLEVDSTYLISFDAKAGAESRTLKMFFGVSDPYVLIREKTFSLSTEMETYTAKVALSSKNEGTKLGFEMGLSNEDVFIDNVSITKTEPEVFTLPVTFESADLDYALTDFGGNSSSVVADPTDATNTVAQTVKPAEAEVWAGTTIGPASGFASAIPFTESATKMSARVWSPVAGATILLKVEDSNDPDVFVEMPATITEAETWETLVFDVTQQREGTAAVNFDNTYDKASIFLDYGNNGEANTFYWDDVKFGEGESSTSTEQDGATIPSDYVLNQNYPNPFNPSTTIEFAMPQANFVTLEVYNMVGQKIATLVQGTRQAGVHTVTFDASTLSSGTYLYRMQAGDQMLLQKMTLIK